LVKEGIVGEVLNLGSQRSFSIKELVDMISEIMSKDVEIKVDPSRFRPFDVDNLVANFDRANRLLGWKPEVSIKDGLSMTVDWLKENGLHINTPYHDQYELE